MQKYAKLFKSMQKCEKVCTIVEVCKSVKKCEKSSQKQVKEFKSMKHYTKACTIQKQAKVGNHMPKLAKV